MSYFAISDIHGCLDNFNELLQYFNPETQTLVLLGDYVDRGQNSLGVLQRIKELKETYPNTVLLCGNHDEMFLDFVKGKEDYLGVLNYLNSNGGKATIESFLDEPMDTSNHDNILKEYERVRLEISERYADLLTFLEDNLHLYFVTDSILFTHAGYNPTLSNWVNTQRSDFLWIRRHYTKRPSTHLINVFGHTSTHRIRESNGGGISYNPLLIEHVKGGYLAIDGGCAYGGQLNAVVLNDRGKLIKTHISG